MPRCFPHFFIDEEVGKLFSSGNVYVLWEIELDMKEVGPAC